jgi:acetylglutamate kinase
MIVLKFGGHAMADSNHNWMVELANFWNSGERLVVVHGGGPAIDAQLKIEGVASDFVDGFRVTTAEVMKVVESVLTGTVLRSVVNSLKLAGLPAVGITGNDGGLLEVGVKEGGRFGQVGDVVSVNPRIISTLLGEGYLPVISPVSRDRNGLALNVNADLVAGAIAGAMSAEQVIFMTDVAGIYRSWPDKDSLIEKITAAELSEMTFTEGMIPKVAAVVSAIKSGAKSARIIDGRNFDAFKEALVGEGGTWVSA